SWLSPRSATNTCPAQSRRLSVLTPLPVAPPCTTSPATALATERAVNQPRAGRVLAAMRANAPPADATAGRVVFIGATIPPPWQPTRAPLRGDRRTAQRCP